MLGIGTDAETQQLQHSNLGSGPIAFSILHTVSIADRRQHWMRKLEWSRWSAKGDVSGERRDRESNCTNGDRLGIIQDLICEMNRKGFNFATS
jgi:hypothetical protein